MAADVLVTQGATTLATMELTYFAFVVLEPDGFW